jgi:hypothetical protein
MSRVELLRASSLKAEAQYRQELSSLRSLRQEESKERHRASETRKDFWKQASAAADPRLPAPNTPSPMSPTERMWRAHDSLKDAVSKHGEVVNKLKMGGERLASMQERVDILQKMISSVNKQRAHRLENQTSDELGDLLAALVKTKGARGSEVGREAERWDLAPSLTQPNATNRNLENSRALDSAYQGVEPERLGAEGVANSPILSVRAVTSDSMENQKSLTVECSLGARGSVSVALVKRDGEAIKAVISPEGNQLALTVQRDKALVLSRLQSLGVRVGSLSVGEESSASSGSGAGQRMKRRSREDDDESRIA